MNATYIVLKRESEMTDADNRYACDIYESGGLNNFIVEMLNALADKNVNWTGFRANGEHQSL